jgi:hypothetical protein
MFEQGDSSKKALVVDLSSSSDEECLISDTSHDEEFARRFFGDGNIIILSDSDEEEEVHEENAADVGAVPSSATGIPTSTASAADANGAQTGCKMIIVVIAPPIGKLTVTTTGWGW